MPVSISDGTIITVESASGSDRARGRTRRNGTVTVPCTDDVSITAASTEPGGEEFGTAPEGAAAGRAGVDGAQPTSPVSFLDEPEQWLRGLDLVVYNVDLVKIVVLPQ